MYVKDWTVLAATAVITFRFQFVGFLFRGLLPGLLAWEAWVAWCYCYLTLPNLPDQMGRVSGACCMGVKVLVV